ncbi:MAG: hypothetical protein LAQ30_16905 [Acidobacteriia bacterium]|nr:hypothetical protein [Terriglobia bacterium]
MHKLPEVEDAKVLFHQAANDWGTWTWLTNKPKVRRAADVAWEALEAAEEKVKASWSDDLKKAYRELEAQARLDSDPKTKREYAKAKEEAQDVAPEIKLKAQTLKEADDEAYEMRMAAEDTFAEAERRLSVSMAKEGSRQAIEAWGMREKVIRKFEASRNG